ncbi:pirin family protein [Nonlabens ponticola]|uniref:Pirin family protein n=1 Tax=Nonlabens ponticola TaxID=2496866 RepID=A0A3S9MUA7_9FLAO|nr:pirin family protein [Nonlabens ponticola]AZQ42756.1 pirin family protein [Nonlabens ponticola]
MKTIIHKANTRGHANHGWLEANHSFSFASWFNPERIQFGALRVLNDDRIAPGAGFPTHPHDNMEIITIPLSGTLEHKDSMGNVAQIKTGEVQVMSAGTGVTHSEYNASDTEELKLFQIWIFPNAKNVEPRYDEVVLKDGESKNRLQQLVSPSPDDAGTWIHQDAYLYITDIDNQSGAFTYQLKSEENGVYTMVISGDAVIAENSLGKRDAIGISNVNGFKYSTKHSARILFIEVPMNF